MPITPVILCGGAGTRLWPASRDRLPKQFLPLFGPRSTFQDTLARVADRDLFDTPIVITNRDHLDHVAGQTAGIGRQADILLEPMRRDSGPAVLAGAFAARDRGGDGALVLVLAADHVVTDPSGFLDATRKAAAAAETGAIVTYGMTPDHPATGYGYIRPGPAHAVDGVHHLDRFVEKPDLETARTYLAEGYLWNSGNFLFRAETLIAEYSVRDPATVASVREAVAKAAAHDGARALDPTSFGAAHPISIDYAVMEHTRNAAVVPAAFGWSDVGSWAAVHDLSRKDEAGNAIAGNGAVLDGHRNLVMSPDIYTAVVGVDDLAVVVTKDAILIGRRDDAAGLKTLVARLKADGSPLT